MCFSGTCNMPSVRHSDAQSAPNLEERLGGSQIGAKYEIGFEIGFFGVRQPVHETIAIAAMQRSDMKLSTNAIYQNLTQQQWEYFRGVIWNDDPSCLLLKDEEGDNHAFGVGIEFLNAFYNGPSNCMTKRSHFGNLQFLHGMATDVGEPAQTTKDKLMLWLEVMYKLACGNQGVAGSDKLAARFPKDFDNSTDPNGDATLNNLILGTTPSYKYVKLERRALGICMHIIQDSYAVGHTQRRFLNCQDLAPRDDQGFIHFKPGTYGKFGPIIAFHSYHGQDEPRHAHYDAVDGHLPFPKKLDTFNGILGARDAIDATIKLVNFFVAKKNWDDGVKQFLADEVFALDANVQPGNTQVDPDPVCSGSLMLRQELSYKHAETETSALMEIDRSRLEDQNSKGVDMAAKLGLLEKGLERNDWHEDGLSGWRLFLSRARHWCKSSWLEATASPLGLATRLCLIALTILGGLLLVWLRAGLF